MKPLKYILAAGLLISLSSEAISQCKGFTKKNCLPSLAPYLSNGQLNAAKMIPGQTAEMNLSFNKGLSYRLLICADPYLENVEYSLTDEKGMLYHSDTLKGKFSLTDLEVTQTKPLKLSLKVPDKENATGIVRNGCVTILVGFKD